VYACWNKTCAAHSAGEACLAGAANTGKSLKRSAWPLFQFRFLLRLQEPYAFLFGFELFPLIMCFSSVLKVPVHTGIQSGELLFSFRRIS
jgi:hypothetical protein